MKASKFLLVGLWGFLGFVSSANAALLGVCTFASGCGPDFAVSSADPIDYTYDAGTGTGVLSFSGTMGNTGFLDGQLSTAFSDVYGNSVPVLDATGGVEAFLMSLTVDSTGNLISGSLSMEGRVVGFPGNITADSANGTLLDGNLIAGGAITQLGTDNVATIDFVGNMDVSSVLNIAGFGTGFGGLIGLNQATITTGSIVWNQSWTADVNSFDVVVPLPAAFWLFLSGITALTSVSRKARQTA